MLNNLSTKPSFSRLINPFLSPWLIAVFFHVLGAWFSVGYHHPDEHYQIWEWANYFVGINPSGKNLPWEFAAQIRPWFQPLLHAGFIKFFLAIDLYNPFTTAFLAREIYALLNIVALYSLFKTLKSRFLAAPYSANLKIFEWSVALLWFFPYIHCRTSSENLAGIFLTFAFSLLLNQSKKMVTIGLLFGFAFLSRYQVALGLAGLGIYFLVKEKKIIRDHVLMLGGFLLAVIAGVLMDRIGYGTWVFTPYQYFNVNLVKGVAATYSPYPWYQYIVWLLQLNPFVTIPIFYGIYAYVKKIKMDPLLAFTSAFCLLQFFITNKEYRFLFPVFNFIPFIIAVGWNKIRLWPWVLINLPGIIGSSFRATSWTLWPLFAFHHHFDPAQGIKQRWITNHGAFDALYYQMPKDFKFDSFVVLEDLKPVYENTQKPVWILWDDHPTNLTFEPVFEFLESRCERVQTSIPFFIYNYRQSVPAIKRLPYQAVYFCEK